MFETNCFIVDIFQKIPSLQQSLIYGVYSILLTPIQ